MENKLCIIILSPFLENFIINDPFIHELTCVYLCVDYVTRKILLTQNCVGLEQYVGSSAFNCIGWWRKEGIFNHSSKINLYNIIAMADYIYKLMSHFTMF